MDAPNSAPAFAVRGQDISAYFNLLQRPFSLFQRIPT